MEEILKIKAQSYGLDPLLVLAIAKTESGLNPWAVRFEPNFMYYSQPAKYASLLGITVSTERTLQQMSFGLMQVMGAVTRELGFDDELLRLSDPNLGAQYGCLKLVDLKKKYVNLSDIVSSYNAGSPSKVGQKYRNQEYVDRVLKEFQKLGGGLSR